LKPLLSLESPARKYEFRIPVYWILTGGKARDKAFLSTESTLPTSAIPDTFLEF
jgi:hypothetical protein